MREGKRSPDLDATLRWVVPAFGACLAVWVLTSVILAIPHGHRHSIESMTPFVVVRDMAFPLWVGALVWLGAALALRAFRSLGDR
ncbi:MAG: hypothetical protein ACXVEI_11465 [Actinomycetota bacterium]